MPTPPTSPKLFSREWWDLRNAVMAEIAAEQARLRRDHPLEIDGDPELRAALAARSKAAMDIALYGTTDGRAEIWEAACHQEARVHSRPAKPT